MPQARRLLFFVLTSSVDYQDLWEGLVSRFVLLLAQVRFRLFEESGTIWAITSLVAFVAFTLILDNMPIVVMVSHLKEKSLRENYSYHHWWGLAKSKEHCTQISLQRPQVKHWLLKSEQYACQEKLSEDKLNPAKLGWDFTNPRKPKEPKEQRKISGYAF
eukprot:3037323-Amphidinium_carterae.2